MLSFLIAMFFSEEKYLWTGQNVRKNELKQYL